MHRASIDYVLAAGSRLRGGRWLMMTVAATSLRFYRLGILSGICPEFFQAAFAAEIVIIFIKSRMMLRFRWVNIHSAYRVFHGIGGGGLVMGVMIVFHIFLH